MDGPNREGITLQEERIRSFIAIEFPEEVHALCTQIQRELQPGLRGISWVKHGNIHITLKFLGDITWNQKDAIVDTLKPVLMDCQPVQLELSGVGVFPNWRRPRVLWVGISKGGESLVTLAKTVEASLHPLGFRRDRKPFRPHLTLGRIRRPMDLTSIQKRVVQYEQFDLQPIHVDRLVLLRSQLHPKGAIYTPQHHFFLGRH